MASSESVQHVGRGGLSFDLRRCQHKTYNEISQRRLSRAVVESRCLGGKIYLAELAFGANKDSCHEHRQGRRSDLQCFIKAFYFEY